jgi:sulfur carrier protein ThiS
MKIDLNSREVELRGHDQITVKELMKEVKYFFQNAVVMINDKKIEEKDLHASIIHDGDKVVIFHLAIGG